MAVQQQTLAPSVQSPHDHYMALAKAFAANPTVEAMPGVEAAYREFYCAFTEGEAGIEEAVADLRAKMMERIGG